MYAFSSITIAIVLEALPFLALGALISGILEVYFPADRLLRVIPQNVGAGIALGLGAGLLIPTCECGVVPVVRRLIGKGVPPYIAVTYMLSAPVLNPVVLASTYLAFQQNIYMVLGRAGGAALIASLIGLSLRRSDEGSILKTPHSHGDECCCHDHHHGHSVMNFHPEGLSFPVAGDSPLVKMVSVFTHGAHEFLDMGKYLILGAFAASFFKTFTPPEVITYLGGNLILSIVGLMALAVLLSVCSEADAFVAASFISFPQAAQLAFVTLGPMVDLKLIGMFGASFSPWVLKRLLIGPPLMVLAISLAFGFFG